jgi:hypothetical protein
VEHQSLQEEDGDSVGQEQSLFSAETQMKSPVVPPQPDEEMASEPSGEVPLASSATDLSPSESQHLTPSTRQEISSAATNEDLAVEVRRLNGTVEFLSGIIKDLSVKQETMVETIKDLSAKHETTTASLTTIGDGIMELTPDNISGITGSTLLPEMKDQLIQTLNEALIMAYSPGGVVAERCTEDTQESMTDFTGTMGNTIISLLLPEINATIVSSLRDGSTALLKMLRSPEIMQASEVAAIVKRELSPQMSEITSGLARMATAVEFSTGSPKDSVLGDSLTHSTPTYEMLKELRFAMRLQGNRLSQGMDFFHKIGFNVLEMLERERWIELEHEQNIRLYFKRLKKIQDLMTVIISDESDASEDSPAFKQQMITYHISEPGS